MESLVCDTYWAKIFLAGPKNIAEQIIREFAFSGGVCVNLYETRYIYRGGEESGYVVELINYPRFPVEKSELQEKAKELADKLLDGTYQSSYTIMFSDFTQYFSKRSW